MTPLYGHTSPETAYVVKDYPYGFKLRCSIRYWLEDRPKGWRLCSQTTNPKKSGEVWNKEKCSTYTTNAACMYLDDEGHVTWTGVSIGTPPVDTLKFVVDFPGADMRQLLPWARAKAVWARKYANGKAFITINGVRAPVSEAEKERALEEAAVWLRIAERLGAAA